MNRIPQKGEGVVAIKAQIALTCLLALPPCLLAQQTWTVETIDEGRGFRFPNIAIDRAGIPKIAYFEEIAFNSSHLEFGTWNGETWELQIIDVTDIPGTTVDRELVRDSAAIALDSAGQPHIAYWKRPFMLEIGTNGTVNYTFIEGDEWVIQTIDDQTFVGNFDSLAVDGNDKLHLSHSFIGEGGTSGLTSGLRYGFFDGSSWALQLVDTNGVRFSHTAIGIDSMNRPHISYCEGLGPLDTEAAPIPLYTVDPEGPSELRYAFFDGASWQSETVDSGGIKCQFTSLALDSADNPHISYYNPDNSELKYATKSSGSWNVQSADNSGIVGLHSSLALDTSGQPHISYYDSRNHDLRYARWNGSAWETQVVADGGDGNLTSIALDADDNPRILFSDLTAKSLKIAIGGAPLPTEVTPPEMTDGSVPFGEVSDLGGGWKFSDWFGSYNDSTAPWMFHAEHGFVFIFEEGVPDSVFYFDLTANGWFWTNATSYPSLFSFARNAWVFYFVGSTGPRNFVDLGTGEFFDLD